MPAVAAKSAVKSIEIEAVLIRADGTRKDLGVVSSYYRNPLKRVWARLARRHGQVRI